jgi:hypothetical protein
VLRTCYGRSKGRPGCYGPVVEGHREGWIVRGLLYRPQRRQGSHGPVLASAYVSLRAGCCVAGLV